MMGVLKMNKQNYGRNISINYSKKLYKNKTTHKKNRKIKNYSEESNTMKKLDLKIFHIMGIGIAYISYTSGLLGLGLLLSIMIFEFFEGEEDIWISASIIGAVWGSIFSEVARMASKTLNSFPSIQKEIKKYSFYTRLMIRLVIIMIIFFGLMFINRMLFKSV